jgi:hypothetical protein
MSGGTCDRYETYETCETYETYETTLDDTIRYVRAPRLVRIAPRLSVWDQCFFWTAAQGTGKGGSASAPFVKGTPGQGPGQTLALTRTTAGFIVLP